MFYGLICVSFLVFVSFLRSNWHKVPTTFFLKRCSMLNIKHAMCNVQSWTWRQIFFKKFGCRIFFAMFQMFKHGCPMYQSLSPHKIHSIMPPPRKSCRTLSTSNPASTSLDLSQDLSQDLSWFIHQTRFQKLRHNYPVLPHKPNI